jgi:hypothetical protein
MRAEERTIKLVNIDSITLLVFPERKSFKGDWGEEAIHKWKCNYDIRQLISSVGTRVICDVNLTEPILKNLKPDPCP